MILHLKIIIIENKEGTCGNEQVLVLPLFRLVENLTQQSTIRLSKILERTPKAVFQFVSFQAS